jgi:hypothetical protein
MPVTVGMIALNAMPWIKYALKCCYDIADKIIIVEGSVPAAKFMAHPCGSSIDDTGRYLDEIRTYPKIEVVRGRWESKLQMSQAYWDKAETGIVWQIDSDECYHPQEMPKILEYFNKEDIQITNTPVHQFWKNTETELYGGAFDTFAPRIFRKKKGDKLIAHRPPAIFRWGDFVTLKDQKHSKPGYLLDNDLYMYHYSWIGDERVRQKAQFFEKLRPDDSAYGKHYKWWYPYVWRAWDINAEATESMHGLHIAGGGKTKMFEGAHPEPIQKAIQRNPTRRSRGHHALYDQVPGY